MLSVWYILKISKFKHNIIKPQLRTMQKKTNEQNDANQTNVQNDAINEQTGATYAQNFAHLSVFQSMLTPVNKNETNHHDIVVNDALPPTSDGVYLQIVEDDDNSCYFHPISFGLDPQAGHPEIITSV